MNATVERPTPAELDQLGQLLHDDAINRPALIATVRRIEAELHDHHDKVDQDGGLLDEGERADRPSLARVDNRLRDQGCTLLDDLVDLRNVASDSASGDDELRTKGESFLAAIRKHHDAEASLVLESADTEVGTGD